MPDLLHDSVDELIARIPGGAKLALAKDSSGVPMAAIRAVIRHGIGDLHLVGVPSLGLAADLLIAAGAVKTIETAAVTLGEYGQAPCFGRAIKSGAIEILDSTCPAIYAALQAAEKGIPFIPLRGLIDTDVLRYRTDYKVIDNPFGEDDPIVLLPAIQPDITLLHAPFGDRFGNLWVGRHRDLMQMAHASRDTLATVEELYEGDLLEDDKLAPGTLSSLYVSGFAIAKNGAWPLQLPGRYPADGDHLALYARMAATEEGVARYIAEFVTGDRAAAE